MMTEKQKIAQYILSENDSITSDNITLLYTPIKDTKNEKKKTIIIASIPKKVVAKAAHRNRIRRQLKGYLLQILPKEVLQSYYWMWIYKNKEPFKGKITNHFTKQIHERIHKEKDN